MRKILCLLKKELMLTISVLMACLSLFLSKPGVETLRSIDWHTLAILFMMLTVLEGFKKEKINRNSPYLSITLHKCYPYYLFGISTFPNSAYHSIALRKFSITIV